MTVEVFIVFSIIAAALFLFITEKFPIDITAFLIMITLMIFGMFYPDHFPSVREGLSGLANPATITVLSMFILSAGIQRTGIIHKMGRTIFSFVGNSELKQILAIGLIVAPISGFINNTAAVAIMLPMVLDMAKRSKTPATKLLIPLSFFGMLGGTLTLLGTSTNILASSLLKDSESFSRDIGMFEFTKLGAVVLVVGSIYLLTVGRHLLPNRKEPGSGEEEGVFLTEVVIEKGCPLIGKTIVTSKLEERTDVKVVKIIREKTSYIKNVEEQEIEEGDILVVKASEQRIIDLIGSEHVKLLPNFDERERRRNTNSGKIVKVMLKSVHVFHDRSLDEIDFWKRFSVAVVGINDRKIQVQRLGSMKIGVGEILLVQASSANLRRLKNSPDFLFLEEIEEEFQPEKMWTALAIVTAVVLAATLGMPIVISALIGVMAMVFTRCLEFNEMYEAVNWEIIFLLAGIIPLGIAMQKSGAAALIAGSIVGVSDGLSPFVLLLIFYLVTTVMTEIISNNAAVVLLVPIALSVAGELHLNSFPFVLAVMFAASTSFLTPVGYQTNTMVYGSGNYKFSDFIKVGAPLNLILLFVTCYLISIWWPM